MHAAERGRLRPLLMLPLGRSCATRNFRSAGVVVAEERVIRAELDGLLEAAQARSAWEAAANCSRVSKGRHPLPPAFVHAIVCTRLPGNRSGDSCCFGV